MTINNMLALDVSKHVEKKNGLTYLSWAHAWAEALKADPTATFHVESFQQADSTTIPYMDVNGTAMVWVRVTLFGKQMTCFLPVMDHRNKPIQKPDAFAVNTALMRCMTKALALHGIGLNIYAGEDLPLVVDDVKPEPKTEAKAEPKVEVKAEAKISVDDRPSAELFAEAMVEYVIVCKTEAGLKSYWKANQTQIDGLKSNHPDLFARVRDVFSDMKAKLKESGNE